MNRMHGPRGNRSRQGVSGMWVVLGVLLLAALLAGGCVASRYNGMVSAQEGVDAEWSNVQNQYKRRMDLVPQLVETVKGAADFERSTLESVTEARASVGRLQLPASLADDPSAAGAFFRAQGELGSALSRLLATVESYPDLKASGAFRDLQSQLEGTENRIAVARRDYIDAVRAYNTGIRRFPANLVASTFGFEALPQLEVEGDVTSVPTIDFGGDG